MTNAHVLERQPGDYDLTVTVTLHNQQEYTARLIGGESESCGSV